MNGAQQDSGEQLRIALVMTGGVSLAVWIGGVTREFGRLVAQSSAYGQLQKLTRTSARVDVISGTSAGGVNGAYFAMALAHHGAAADLDANMASLRELWISKGSIAQLLRDPFARDTPSLLDGDGYFYGELREAIGALASSTPTSPENVPIDLLITTTLLHGRRRLFADDFGSRVEDVNHRARFRFSRGHGNGHDPFVDPDIADRLALAARCTASFPGAFEPSFCPVNEATDKPERPDMKGFADFAESHFVIDGGVLDNKPLDIALERIFRQPTEGPARRALVYVVPDPGLTARSASGPSADVKPDQPQPSPQLLDVVLASLVEIPGAQSISSQMEALRDHNLRVRERRHARIVLTRHNTPEQIDALAATLFSAYRELRVTTAVDYIIDQINAALLTQGSQALRQRSRQAWLQRYIADPCAPWIPSAAPSTKETADNGAQTQATAAASEQSISGWRWGTRPIEHMSRLLLDIVRRFQRLAANLPDAPSLAVYWKAAFELLEQVERLRAVDRTFWREQADKVAKMLDARREREVDDADARDWLATAIDDWRGRRIDPLPAFGDAPSTLHELAGRLGACIAEILLGLRNIVEFLKPGDSGATDAIVEAESRDLESLYTYFVRKPDDGIDIVVSRLLAFEVVQEALGGRGTLTEEEIDYIQISGEGLSSFGGPSQVESKLAGVQLAHFGAFYKRSWRANDWLWGRVDAVRRIVMILLDPERLRLVARFSCDAGERARYFANAIASIALEGDEEARAELAPSLDLAAMEAELTYLDHPETLAPQCLRVAVDAVCRRVELEILREELPLLAAAVKNDRLAGAREGESAQAFVTACDASTSGGLVHAKDVRRLVSMCAIGKERLDNEFGTDRLSTIASQAVALTVSAVREQQGWFASAGAMLGMLRIPSLLFFVATRNALLDSRTGLVINTAMFVFGIVVVATALISPGFYAGWMLALGVSAFIASILLALLQFPKIMKWLVAAAAAVAILALAVNRHRLPQITLEQWRIAALAGWTVVFLIALVRFAAPRWSRRFGRQRG